MVALLEGPATESPVVAIAGSLPKTPHRTTTERLAGNQARAMRERRSRSDPEALRALVEGSASRIGLDLERLKELKSANFKPLMEYLGYIQVQRGGNETLLFVRMKDLDELADLAGQSREEFVKQFKKLGVLLSMN